MAYVIALVACVINLFVGPSIRSPWGLSFQVVAQQAFAHYSVAAVALLALTVRREAVATMSPDRRLITKPTALRAVGRRDTTVSVSRPTPSGDAHASLALRSPIRRRDAVGRRGRSAGTTRPRICRPIANRRRLAHARRRRGGALIATGLFTRAIAMEPEFARAYAELSFTHFQNAFLRYVDTPDSARMAQRYAAECLERDPLDPFGHFTMGRAHWLHDDLEGSLSWLEKANALNPNYAQARYSTGWAASIRARAGYLNRNDFLRALPFRDAPTKARVTGILTRLGF